MRNFAIISDVHIKNPQDDAYHLFLSFLRHKAVKESQSIILLGDIFDLMCGDHAEYGESFKEIWIELQKLLIEKKQIYYFEGNHDLHLKKLFSKILPYPNFQVLTSATILDNIYFSHGDEHDRENKSYQDYKKFITRPSMNFFANYIMPYFLLEQLGRKASKRSRDYGALHFDKEKVKEKFRSGASLIQEHGFDVIVGGHSHVKDYIKLSSGKLFVNNGFALSEKTFIQIIDEDIKFVSLV